MSSNEEIENMLDERDEGYSNSKKVLSFVITASMLSL